jgi:hypothetical protein
VVGGAGAEEVAEDADEPFAVGLGEDDAAGVEPEPEEPEELAELEGAAPACTVGCGPAVRVRRWWCLPGEWEAVPEVAADVCVLGVPAVWLTVWAGAVRTNKVTRPTAATVLSWVARQVSLESLRSPWARVSAGSSWAMIVVGEVVDAGSRYGSPSPWVGW